MDAELQMGCECSSVSVCGVWWVVEEEREESGGS